MDNSNLIKQWLEIGKRNAWIKNACDPEFNEKSFYHCPTIEDLEQQLRRCNWCLGQAFYYQNLCFINQVGGGDEWLTIKDGVAFESITFRGFIERGEFNAFIERLLNASLDDCKNLKY